MLNIPATIQTLFKTDGVRKNFRVHFPNGEFSDITNDNIVRESVHFTESLCSQEVFKFGLAEASVIEFETVGIGNMYGMIIECAYEIDTSSLSAAQITAIQSDPGDGTLVLSSASDIGYGFYRVPLGTFRVESCPRNHGAMTHRKVTGYSSFVYSANQFEIGKLAFVMRDNLYTPSLLSEALMQIASTTKDLQNLGYTSSTIYPDVVFATKTRTWSRTYKGSGNEDITFVQTGQYKTEEVLSSGDALYSVPTIQHPESDAINYVKATLQQSGVDLAASGFASWDSIAKDFLRGLIGGPLVRFADDSVSHGTLAIPENKIFYPIRGSKTAFEWPLSLSTVRTRLGTSTTIQIFNYSSITDRLYKWNPPASLSSVATLKGAFQPTGSFYGGSHFSYIGAVPDRLIESLFEPFGKFAKQARNGGIDVVELDPLSTVSIIPGNYSECWWDEYDVSPIGTVTVSYLNGEEGEATADINIGDGLSFYDMTQNEALKNIGSADLSTITTLLSGDFATNAANAGFTPVDLVMQGWPWMEAGDALQITAEDGTVVDTYALRIEMSGIQHLTAAIQSQGGEIIGEV